MPTTHQHEWQLAGLNPLYPRHARMHHVRLPASVSYRAGQVLGEATGTNEAQTVTLSTSGTLGGTYTLAFGGAVTGALDFDFTAAEVQAALEGLATIGANNVAVTGATPTTSGGVLTVTFQNALGSRDVLALVADGASLTGSGSAVAVATATAGAGLANETQVIYANGTVSGGTLTITFDGEETGDIAFDATPAEVQAALEALPNVQPGDVVVTGTANVRYILAFGGAYAGTNAALVVIDNTDITGGGSYLVATTVGGAAGTPGTFREFDATGTDGRQTPRALLAYDCSTDSAGNHTWGLTAGVSEHQVADQSVPAYFAGEFATGDLVGLTAQALVNNPGWRLINGTVAHGAIRI